MRKILILLLLLPIICQAQYTQQIGATKTTDTTKIISQVKFTSLATSDTNKVLGINSNGQLIWRIKGGGLEGDSAQTVFGRGRNTTIPLRFGSGANTVNTTIDSTTVFVGLSGGLYSSITPGVFRSLSTGGTESYDYKYNGIQKTDRSTNRTTSLYLPNSPGGNLDIYTQAKSGTTAYLSDFNDTLLGRNVLFATDTLRLSGSKNVVTQAQLNVHSSTNVLLGGNTVGGRFITGSIDSQDFVNRYYNKGDTVRVSDGLHTYEAKNSEVIARYFNYNQTTGVRNSKGVLLFSSLTTEGQNYPGICFGSTYSTSNPRITETGLFGYTLLNLYGSTTAGTIIKPAFSGVNTGDALTLALGSYTISSNAPTASGIMNMFKLGTGYLSTGKWAPTSGSSTLNMILGSVNVNASGTYTGNVNFVADDSVLLVGLGSGGTYYGYRATKNSGWGFFQNNSGAKNAFVGRSLFGTTTDNTVDGAQFSCDINMVTAGNKLKIKSGSNASVGTGTMSGGTCTISTTAVPTTSHITITPTSAVLGTFYVTKVPGTSFTVTSSNAGDNFTFTWHIIEIQ